MHTNETNQQETHWNEKLTFSDGTTICVRDDLVASALQVKAQYGDGAYLVCSEMCDCDEPCGEQPSEPHLFDLDIDTIVNQLGE